ncbi:2-hydroxy-3-oxopropionate reductase [Cloacibacillus porcorum]|uniref:2-hydroxy-3-oxopropionate reductase n=1 Tax=Cloacibacillus porcorum TaxID=1197717 RepID=UPI0023F01314|nr:2-hydroxy-3-oxopropionate reductase [Cloacibacillus porcorum]MDD7650043.1 2-hydroxy-3-oxopropionate reductase [Cloacibacillus porcorum]MDY4094930.1 2-hydroxy-3-oxopropionate reductase [Cloacibacillus porcorum]
MDKIGFIGLGIMGRPMAKNLIKAGYAVVVCDVNQQAVEELRACGAESAATPAETAEKAGTFIVTMLPNSPQVREVTAGENGLLKGICAGQIVVDMSSISPIASRELDALLREKGAEMLDAPVSGGQEKAEQGTLAIMVGGSAAAFEKARPILEKMGATVTLVGESGAGQITKLVNQMIVGINISAVAEGMAFAKKAGVEPRRVFEAIRKGLAGSQCLEDKAPRMFEGRYDPGFRINLHIKDLWNVLETSRAVSCSVPLSGQVIEMMIALANEGHETKDHGSLGLYYEKLNNVVLKEIQK